MRRHNFFLPVETVNQLKTVAEKRGVTTSEVIRQALEAWLKAYRKQQEAQHGR